MNYVVKATCLEKFSQAQQRESQKVALREKFHQKFMIFFQQFLPYPTYDI